MEAHSPALWLDADSPSGFKASLTVVSSFLSLEVLLQRSCLFLPYSASPQGTVFPWPSSVSMGQRLSPGHATARAPCPACPCSEGYPKGWHQHWPEGAEPTEGLGLAGAPVAALHTHTHTRSPAQRGLMGGQKGSAGLAVDPGSCGPPFCSHPVTLNDRHSKGTMSPISVWSPSPQVTISHPWLAAVPLPEGSIAEEGAQYPLPGSFPHGQRVSTCAGEGHGQIHILSFSLGLCSQQFTYGTAWNKFSKNKTVFILPKSQSKRHLGELTVV